MDRQQRINELAGHLGLNQDGVPFFLLATGEGSSFNQHFNPELAQQSHYHHALEKMMSCVDRNADVPAEKRATVCAKEYKQLRLAAFDDKLLYHHMNWRFFTSELAIKNGETAI